MDFRKYVLRTDSSCHSKSEVLVRTANSQHNLTVLLSDLIRLEIPLTETVSPNLLISAFNDIFQVFQLLMRVQLVSLDQYGCVISLALMCVLTLYCCLRSFDISV